MNDENANLGNLNGKTRAVQMFSAPFNSFVSNFSYSLHEHNYSIYQLQINIRTHIIDCIGLIYLDNTAKWICCSILRSRLNK